MLSCSIQDSQAKSSYTTPKINTPLKQASIYSIVFTNTGFMSIGLIKVHTATICNMITIIDIFPIIFLHQISCLRSILLSSSMRIFSGGEVAYSGVGGLGFATRLSYHDLFFRVLEQDT